MSAAWEAVADGVLLHVRVTPKGGRDSIDGVWTASDGRRYLAVRVSAPPQDGAATEAVRRLIAKQAGLPRSAVTVEAGELAREKRLRLTGDAARLTAWLETTGTKT